MSAQHIPGMLQVAVEVFDNDGCPETVIQGMSGAASVAVALDFGPNNPGWRYANARRLVACWNACEGIGTEHLEALLSHGERIVEFRRTGIDAAHGLLAQRDELLAALRGLLSIYSSDSAEQEVITARAAITNTTGRTA